MRTCVCMFARVCTYTHTHLPRLSPRIANLGRRALGKMASGSHWLPPKNPVVPMPSLASLRGKLPRFPKCVCEPRLGPSSFQTEGWASEPAGSPRALLGAGLRPAARAPKTS